MKVNRKSFQTKQNKLDKVFKREYNVFKRNQESEVRIRNPKDARYAYEWFMRAEDKRYWNMAKELIKKEKKNTIKIAATLTAISMATTATIISFQLHKFQKR